MGEVLSIYIECLGRAWPIMALLLGVSVVSAELLHRRPGWRARLTAGSIRRWIPRIVLALALSGGLALVYRRASLFDDAYISFRYARHWAQGHGWVFNLGERVEGYTNFLWTLLIGLLVRLFGWEAPSIGLFGSALAWIANLGVVYALSRRLAAARGDAFHLPLSVPLLAANRIFASYGTSGLETMAASLLVDVSVLFLTAEPSALRRVLAGWLGILATMARPDQAIFYAAGSLAVVGETAGPMWRARGEGARAFWRAGLGLWAAYAAPFLLYAAYLCWKLDFYGAILPNTFYAKAVDQAAFSRSGVYLLLFYLGAHFWLPTLLFLLWLVVPAASPASARLRRFAVPSVLLFNGYVGWIGGDFMESRFFVSLMPLLLLGAEDLLHALARRPSPRRIREAGLAAGMMLASAHGVAILPPHTIRWGIADEGTYYPLAQLWPPVGKHPADPFGRMLGRLFTDRGLLPTISTSGIGLIAYHSRLPLVDKRGLTDAHIAHQRIDKRGRPGHEKMARLDYLRARKVHFGDNTPCPERFHELTRLRFPRPTFYDWRLVVYDRDLMRRIRQAVPELDFTPFEPWLDRYIAELPDRDPDRVAEDYEWFRGYYFDHNADPERQGAIERRLAERGVPPAP